MGCVFGAFFGSLALSIGLVLVVWGGLHYFLEVPAPSALPFPEPKPISSVSEIKSEIKSGVKSLTESDNMAIATNTSLLESAKESYKHEFGPQSGLRKHYKYLTPKFRSQCSEDDFVRAFMPLSLIIGMGESTKLRYSVHLCRAVLEPS